MIAELSKAYAGDTGDIIIETVELKCSAWSDSIRMCNGFVEQSLYVNESGRMQLFLPTDIAVQEPKRDNRGSQSVQFILQNVTGEAQQRIEDAVNAGAKIEVLTRFYLASRKDRQASNTLKATVKSVRIDRMQVQVTAGFNDMLGTNFNRITYNADTAPCLMYQ